MQEAGLSSQSPKVLNSSSLALAREFVRLCLSGRWDAAAQEEARRQVERGALDWEAVRQVAADQGLAPLLYLALRDWEGVPPSFRRELQGSLYRHVGLDTTRWHQLEGVLQGLAATGVEVILLKGAALAATVYGDAPGRPMGDVDLLVRREDAPGALHALAGLGYALAQPEVRPGAELQYRYAATLRRPDSAGATIDLHWGLFHSQYYQHRLPMEWFWERPQHVLVGQAGACVLRPAAQVLHLCAHVLLHHSDSELLRLHDIAAVIAHYRAEMDWGEVLAGAQRCELLLPLQRLLPPIVNEWRAPVPAPVLQRLRLLQPSAGEVQVVAALTTRDRPVAQRFWDDLMGVPGWGARVRFLWVTLFPSPQHMLQRYHIRHPLLLPLYYPYHWLRSWGNGQGGTKTQRHQDTEEEARTDRPESTIES